MAKITKSAGTGKFRRTADSAPRPVTADLTAAGDVREGIRKATARVAKPEPFAIDENRSFLHQTSDASQRHKTQRIGTDADGRSRVDTSGPEGRALTSITPAASIGQLQAQISKIIDAFRRAEGRDPTVDDAEFWSAYASVVRAFIGPRAGSPERAAEPLNAATPVRKAVRTALNKGEVTCSRCGRTASADRDTSWKGELCDECRSDD